MKIIRTTCAVMATFALFGAAMGAQAQSGNWTDTNNRDTMWPDAALGHFAGNTYYIATEAQLAQFAYLVTTGLNFAGMTVELTKTDNDGIYNLSPRYWAPIGTPDGAMLFAGTFDGKGKTIKGLTTRAGTAGGAGLFSYLRENTCVKNIMMTDVLIYKSVSGVSDLGAIAGGVLGAVGTVDALIENCIVASGIIHLESTGSGSAGGIAGLANGLTLANCANAAEVRVTVKANAPNMNYAVGGLVGLADRVTFLNCLNKGQVVVKRPAAIPAASYAKAGGIFGQSAGSVLIENCFNSGWVTVPATGNGLTTYGGAVYAEATGATALANVFYFKKNEVPDPVYGSANVQGAYAVSGNVPGNTSVGPLLASLNNWVSGKTTPGGAAYYAWDAPLGILFNNGYPTFVVSSQGYDDPPPMSNVPATVWPDYRDETWPEHHMDGETYETSTYFTIHTPEQLAQFAWYVEQGNDFEGRTVTLANEYYDDEFNMAQHLWVAAGSTASPFCGTFEGNGKTVKGITIFSNDDDIDCNGFFGCATDGAVIRNLRLTDIFILTEASESATAYCPSVGAIAGIMNGKMENCFVVNGTISVVGKGGNVITDVRPPMDYPPSESPVYAPIPSDAHIDRWFDATGILCLAGNSTRNKAPVNGRYFVAFADDFWTKNTQVKIAFTSNSGKNGSYAIITEDGMQFFDASGAPRNDIAVVPARINMAGVKGVIKNIKPKHTAYNWLNESFDGFWFTNPHGKGAMQAHLQGIDSGSGVVVPGWDPPKDDPQFFGLDDASMNVGGLVGDSDFGGVTFLNCANRAGVSASASGGICINLGGLMGREDMTYATGNDPAFRNCLNTGELSVVGSDTITAAYVGGLVGQVVDGNGAYEFQFLNCFNSGWILPVPETSPVTSRAGGLLGKNINDNDDRLFFESCYFFSTRIMGSTMAHGFAVGNHLSMGLATDITFPGAAIIPPQDVWDTGDMYTTGLQYWVRTQPEGLYLWGGLYCGWTYDGTDVDNDGYPVLDDTFTGTKVTFHAQDGDTLKCQTVYARFPDTTTYKYVLPLNNPTRAGYDFDGWVFRTEDGGGVVDADTDFYYNSSSFTHTPTEVVATWKVKSTGGEDEQWLRIGEIIAPPLTGNADVLLAWDTAQISWYTPEFRAIGTTKYIVYTSDTLTLPVSEWAEQYETGVDTANVLITIDQLRFGIDGIEQVWDQVRMLDSAKETTRFYKVKAVKVLN